MKGVFESRRLKPKYNKIWDVSAVLKHLSSLYPNEKLSSKDLTHKVLMLILLVSSQRGQSIHYLDLQHLTIEEDNYSFDVAEHINTSTPRNPHTRIDIAASEPDSTICPSTCSKAYLNKTKALRNNETKLFISYVRPHKTVSGDTVSRWTKETLRLCGIDTKVFTAHSTTSASVSKANEKTSLSMRSWQRHAGSLQRPSVNITTNRLFKETDLLPLSLTSENVDMF